MRGESWTHGWPANGHRQAPDLWESYVVWPESGDDSSNWQTGLNRPLAD